jgi:hypothetical protein
MGTSKRGEKQAIGDGSLREGLGMSTIPGLEEGDHGTEVGET